MENSQLETSSLDLTQFVKDLKIEKGIRPLQSLTSEKYFEPIPNNFYGFSIEVKDLFSPVVNKMERELNTIDIEYEDLTNQKLISHEVDVTEVHGKWLDAGTKLSF